MQYTRLIAAVAAVAILVPLTTAGAQQIGLIDSADVRNNTLRSGDIKNNTVRSKDVRNGHLTCLDFRAATRKAIGCNTADNQGDAGDRGPGGPVGGTGNPGPSGPPGDDALTRITSLPGPGFDATNDSCSLTPDGFECGPYADGGADGGSLYYDGLNGLTLADVAQLAYSVRHSTSDNSPISAPYLRIFLEGDFHDVIFDATECATVVPEEGVFNTYEVTVGDVRYDDDSCDGVPPDQQTWDAVVAAHGTEVISGIYITTGFAGGADLRSLVRWLEVNNERFVFGS